MWKLGINIGGFLSEILRTSELIKCVTLWILAMLLSREYVECVSQYGNHWASAYHVRRGGVGWLLPWGSGEMNLFQTSLLLPWIYSLCSILTVTNCQIAVPVSKALGIWLTFSNKDHIRSLPKSTASTLDWQRPLFLLHFCFWSLCLNIASFFCFKFSANYIV